MREVSTPRTMLLVSNGKPQLKSQMPQRQLTAQTSSCVPNPSKIHILAPVFNPGICPSRSERWELRTRGLGCQVSTITFFTCIISVCSTLVFIGLVAIGIIGIRRFKRWRSQNSDWWEVWRLYRPGWCRGWRLRAVPLGDRDSADQRPLLADA